MYAEASQHAYFSVLDRQCCMYEDEQFALTSVDLVLDGRQLPTDGANQVIAELARQEVHSNILEVCISRVSLEELQFLGAC